MKGFETTLGKTRPSTLMTVMNTAGAYCQGFNDIRKARELYQRALEGYEAQFGKDHRITMFCAKNLSILLRGSHDYDGLVELKKAHPNVENY